MNHKVEIYTDGSSLGNPGPGGWGVVMLHGGQVHELGGAQDPATNNQMELRAMQEALGFLAGRGVSGWEITIYSDSKYVLGGITEWMYGWSKKNWKKSDGKPVLNPEQWQDLLHLKDYLETDNKLFFHHIEAHTGHEHNERADAIARGLAEGKKIDLRTES